MEPLASHAQTTQELKIITLIVEQIHVWIMKYWILMEPVKLANLVTHQTWWAEIASRINQQLHFYHLHSHLNLHHVLVEKSFHLMEPTASHAQNIQDLKKIILYVVLTLVTILKFWCRMEHVDHAYQVRDQMLQVDFVFTMWFQKELLFRPSCHQHVHQVRSYIWMELVKVVHRVISLIQLEEHVSLQLSVHQFYHLSILDNHVTICKFIQKMDLVKHVHLSLVLSNQILFVKQNSVAQIKFWVLQDYVKIAIMVPNQTHHKENAYQQEFRYHQYELKMSLIDQLSLVDQTKNSQQMDNTVFSEIMLQFLLQYLLQLNQVVYKPVMKFKSMDKKDTVKLALHILEHRNQIVYVKQTNVNTVK